jgi:hypothetical protein
MNISIVLAQVLGIMFAVLGISMFSNKKIMATVVNEMTTNRALLWLGGVGALAMGAILIALNNVWSSGLPLLITVIGWLALLKGLSILFFPNSIVSYYKKMNKGDTFVGGGVFVLILGLILLYSGFM